MNAISLLAHVLCISKGLAAATPLIPTRTISIRQDGGSLEYSNSSQPFTFDYTTSQQSPSNYIGLWAASGGGPVDQQLRTPSLRWEYAPAASGSIEITPEHLDPGQYTAVFLATTGDLDEADVRLADPINVVFTGLPADISFPVDKATLHNARHGEPYHANIGGLVLGRGRETVTFKKLSGAPWIHVQADGTVSGTPTRACSRTETLDVQAMADNGSKATIHVSIPVRRADELLLDELAVMSYNLRLGGTQVHDYHEKQLRFILQSNADIIGVQEAADVVGQDVHNRTHVERLGQALGWHHWSSNFSTGFLSRYPIVKEHGQVLDYSSGVRINLNGYSEDVREVDVWNTHPYPVPYGPHEFCLDNSTKAEVMAIELGSRGMQVQSLLDAMEEQLEKSEEIPVLLVGDMNAPSHLDWTEATKDSHCGILDFDWPTSKLPSEAGLIDSFRVAHPDPVAEPGITWSPIHKLVSPTSSEREPQDRIDFVYATKELEVISSETVVVGEPRPIPYERENEWTSDHSGVLTHFRLPCLE